MSKILLVDDDVKSCELLENFFEMKGHDVIMAYSGMQAFEMAQGEKPDITLLDTSTLGTDGIEVLMRMRESDRNMGIIMLTAAKDKEAAKDALKVGADDYITKPVNYALLESKIVSCLMKRKK